MQKYSSIEILRNLVGFKSITPDGEQALGYISDLLEDLGFQVDLKVFGEGEKQTWNLYAFKFLLDEGILATEGTSDEFLAGNEIGSSNEQFLGNLCFAGHVDVVPPGDISLWSHDPFKLTEIGESVYGRGVVDMKGAIAAFISAVANFLNEHNSSEPNRNTSISAVKKELEESYEDAFKKYNGRAKGIISLLITSDEEGTGEFGTQKMLNYIENLYDPIDFCIVGEPTSENQIGDVVKIGRRGSISFILTIHGKQGHVAYPELAKNPISDILRILHEIDDIVFDQGNEYFSASNLEITSIDTNNLADNVIPAKVTAKFNIRFNDSQTIDGLIKTIENITRKYSNNYNLEYQSSSLPFIQEYSQNMKDFSEVIRSITGISPKISTSGGTSDARFIHKFSEVIEFGLKSATAHKIDEYCEKCDLQILQEVYYSYLSKFFKSG